MSVKTAGTAMSVKRYVPVVVPQTHAIGPQVYANLIAYLVSMVCIVTNHVSPVIQLVAINQVVCAMVNVTLVIMVVSAPIHVPPVV